MNWFLVVDCLFCFEMMVKWYGEEEKRVHFTLVGGQNGWASVRRRHQVLYPSTLALVADCGCVTRPN